MKTITNKFKFALVAVGMLAVGTVSAQTTTGDLTVQTPTTLGNAGGVVKLIDNKGTIKYLQAENGLTSFTNTTPSGGVVTTWQLGGTLTENTYITAVGESAPAAGDQKEFALDGLELVTAGTASINSADRDIHGSAAAATGFTVLIRDEATGAVQKIQLSDLFEVTAIRREATPATNTTPGVQNIVIAGLPVINAANEAKLFVFRNGVKLRWTTDFTGATAGSIDINISADLPLYLGDIIEVQYIN